MGNQYHVGRLAQWDDARGFGFLEPLDGGPRVFLHIRALPPGTPRPVGGEMVRYQLAFDERQRPRAEAAAFLGERGETPEQTGASLAAAAAAAFVLALVILAAAGRSPWPAPLVVAALSAWTFHVYRSDKEAALEGRRRTPESELHTLALLGGWPGALVAQQRLRHKSRKASFQVGFWVTVAANLALLALLGATGFARLP